MCESSNSPHWLEIVNWASQIVLVGIAGFGLWSLKHAKQSVDLAKTSIDKDVDARAESIRRENMMTALDMVQRFIEEVTPKMALAHESLPIDLGVYQGPRNLEFAWQDGEAESEWLNRFNGYINSNQMLEQVLAALAAIHSFSIPFIHSLADVEVARPEVSGNYVQFMNDFYPVIAHARTRSPFAVQSAVLLYQKFSVPAVQP